MSDSHNRPELDAVVVGAGLGGIYQLHRLRQLGLDAVALEAGSGVGGTWHWNRYPGARNDSESYTYVYGFSPELIQDWSWSEHYAGQPELLRYFNHVVDHFGLREHIRLDTRVASARYEESANLWRLTTVDGWTLSCRYLVFAIGTLSAPVYPAIPGLDSFAGTLSHTARWPEGGVSFDGKRVGVVGTGATGVQVIQEAAKTAGSLTVFQRTPNYCVPLKNRPISDDEQGDLKSRIPQMYDRCRSTNTWFLYDPDPRSVFDLSDDEREQRLEELYHHQGIATWKGNFRDISADEAANEVVSDFIRTKIRQRVDDPETAEKLVPTDHGFGTRRVPLETHYYEVYNQSNVRLVDISADPIRQITPTSVVVGEEEIDLDVLVVATGFDAVTGAFDQIVIEGLGGQRLDDKWGDQPQTYLGVLTAGFPNMFMVGGPLASLGNFGPALEFSVDWITDLLDFMTQRGLDYVDADEAAEREFIASVLARATDLLVTRTQSWITGTGGNAKDGGAFKVLLNVGSAQEYRETCEAVRQGGYRELVFASKASVTTA